MAASASDEPVACEEHCMFCFQAIEAAFDEREPPKPSFPHAEYRLPFFVTLKKSRPGGGLALRGCIGSLSGRPLGEIGDYALKSAFEDGRFEPLRRAELKDLHCSVSLLVRYERDKRWDDWVVGTHGIIIDFTGPGGRAYRATYLPEVAREMGWTVEEAIESLIRKSGWKGTINPALLASISLTRYQSSKASLPYHEYARRAKEGGGD